MSSGKGIIQSALEEIGAHSLTNPAPRESLERGKDSLNSMLHLWLSWNIDIGFTPLDNYIDELSEPADTRNGIIYNLAIELSNTFDDGNNNVIPPKLKDNARRTFAMIRRVYQVLTIPDKIVSSTLPLGAGNNRHWRHRVFAGKGRTVNG